MKNGFLLHLFKIIILNLIKELQLKSDCKLKWDSGQLRDKYGNYWFYKGFKSFLKDDIIIFRRCLSTEGWDGYLNISMVQSKSIHTFKYICISMFLYIRESRGQMKPSSSCWNYVVDIHAINIIFPFFFFKMCPE